MRLYLRAALLPIFFLFIVFAGFFTAQAQEAVTLDDQYKELKASSETYDVYKVIRTTRLDHFWDQVRDTIRQQTSQIQELQAQKASLSTEIAEGKRELDSVKHELSESLKTNNSILFFGINFNKIAYHFFVWIIIVGLSVLAGFVFLMYKRSHVVTSQCQRDHQKVVKEYEEYREHAREKQVKLKRELQTAINNLDDLRKKRG
ncbi:MAG: hypothetical protein OEY56_07465 [Cyclobacteriaceae bacterium]|nr:hypothetical protein [Cyclobacteriaceae bacterium]